MSHRLESFANIAVIGVALLVGSVLVRRELRPHDTPVATLPPGVLEYVPEWQEIEASGLPLDSSSSAPLRVSIFTDLECGYCARLHLRTLPQLREKFGDKFTVTVVHSPIRTHRFAMQSAMAVECAANQRSHREMLDAVYEKQDSIGLRPWSEFADDAGLQDLETFSQCMKATSTPRIDAGLKWAQNIALQFTPTVIVNGWRFPSAPQAGHLAPVFEAILDGRDPTAKEGRKR
jgi:protein-disulfide isomerase